MNEGGLGEPTAVRIQCGGTLAHGSDEDDAMNAEMAAFAVLTRVADTIPKSGDDHIIETDHG